jgi:hypothetical protein
LFGWAPPALLQRSARGAPLQEPKTERRSHKSGLCLRSNGLRLLRRTGRSSSSGQRVKYDSSAGAAAEPERQSHKSGLCLGTCKRASAPLADGHKRLLQLARLVRLIGRSYRGAGAEARPKYILVRSARGASISLRNCKYFFTVNY